jgi:hypothetical protein
MKLSFKTFLEMADYGYDRDQNKPNRRPAAGMPSTCPLKPVNSEEIMEVLKRLPPIGALRPKWSWQDIMEWGDDVGAVKLDVSPLGSYKIVTRRKIHDLEGTERWICKSVLPLNDEQYAHTQEEVLAHHLYESVQKISRQQIERAEPVCETFERLCHGLTAKCRQRHPQVMLYRGTKRMNDHYFKIYFEYRGQGVEAPGQKRMEQFDINFQFDPKIGLIRCWGAEIESSKGQREWKVSPSQWDEYFAPTQDKDEIIENIRTILNTY